LGLEKSKKSTLGIVGIIVIAIGVGSFFFFEESVGRESLKIGVTLSISGSGSDVGELQRDGMQMAADEINSRGGIDGRPIELIIEDNQSSPAGKYLYVHSFCFVTPGAVAANAIKTTSFSSANGATAVAIELNEVICMNGA